MQKTLDELQKQHKAVCLQATNLSDKCMALENAQAQLENQPEDTLSSECNSFIDALSCYLMPPLIDLCQAYNTSKICKFCKLYHLIGFCPQECFSLDRKDFMKHTFSSCISTCIGQKAGVYMCATSAFRDESDNALWQWIIDSTGNAFPKRVYKRTQHHILQHATNTSPNMKMEIWTMWSGDKIPRPRVHPPLIRLKFAKNSDKFHIVFESVAKKTKQAI